MIEMPTACRTSVMLPHIWMSHVTRMNESCHTFEWVMSIYECVMSHVWMSHVTRMNESRHTYEWVTSHIRMSHVAHIRISHVTHISMSHVTHMNDSRHTNERVMSYMRMRHRTSHVIYESVTCLVPVYGVATISRLFKIIGLFCKRAL